MTRLVIMCALFSGMVLVLNFKEFKSLEVNQDRFDYKKQKEEYKSHVKLIAELEEAKKPKKEVVEVKKPEGPLVVLDTPELERGSKLYAKCIVCHGKRGEGKKSQNAPAVGGQYDWYVVKQIQDMKNKVRVNKIMDPYIKRLSDQDISDLGTYISKLPWVK